MPTNEMNTCRVKFSVKLDQLSEKLSTKVKNVIKSSPSTVLEKEFDFFVPPMWSADSIAETSPEITTVTEEIEEWISDSYSSFVSPVYGERLANHAVSYILRIFPSYPLGDAKFRILCYYFIVAFILDDYFDDNTGEGDGDDSAETKKIKYFETATNTIGEMFEMKGVGGGKDEIDFNQVATKAMGMDLFKEQPFFIAIANSIEDTLPQIQEINKEITLNKFWAAFKVDFRLGCESVRWTLMNARSGKLDSFCVDTYRYFKAKESGFGNFLNIITILECIDLPEVIQCNPVFAVWFDIAQKLFGLMNDVLGLQKDLLYGEEDGMVMFKVRKGTSLNDAVDEELKLLGDYVKDYMELRKSLLTEFEEKYGQVATFVKFVDAALHGSPYTFRDSIKYGMKDQIRMDYK